MEGVDDPLFLLHTRRKAPGGEIFHNRSNQLNMFAWTKGYFRARRVKRAERFLVAALSIASIVPPI